MCAPAYAEQLLIVSWQRLEGVACMGAFGCAAESSQYFEYGRTVSSGQVQ
jgi:hypothetical protein